jgi:hypothetical protein
MQSSQVRVRLSEDNFDFLRRLAEEAGLQQVDVATMLVHASLSALREAGESAPFPIRFKICEDKKTAKTKRGEP